MTTQKVKGSVLRSRLDFVRDQGGEDALARVLESLSPEDQKALHNVIPVAWLPFEIGKRLDDAIVRVLGGGDRIDEAGRAVNDLYGRHRPCNFVL